MESQVTIDAILVFEFRSSSYLNIYMTPDYLKQYSKNNAMANPIFAPPQHTFAPGDSQDVQLFVKNDSPYQLTGIVISIVDTDSYDKTDWFKLANTQGELDSATAGAPLSLSDLNPTEMVNFWIRVEVSVSAEIVNLKNIKLQADYKANQI